MYITSIYGSYIYDYLGHKSFTEKNTGDTVLFPSGSEFIVCKVAKEKNQLTGKEIDAVYLRNINLGLCQGETFLWTDNNISTHKIMQYERIQTYRIKYM